MGMQAKVAAAVVAVALLGGGLVVWSARHDDTPADRASASAVATDTAGPRVSRPGASREDVATGSSSSRRSGRAAPDPGRGGTESDEQAARLPAEGSGRITGRVLTATGGPVAGATVTAVAAVPGDLADDAEIAGSDTSADPEARIRSFERRVRWEFSTRRQAATDRDGSYVLDGLSSVAYVVAAKATGFAISRAGPQPAQAARPGSVVDFEAVPQAEMVLQVLLPSGTPADRAEIRVRRDGNRWSIPWTSERRPVGWKPGRWSVQAVGGEYGELSSDPVDVELNAQSEPVRLTLSLRNRPGICGTVRFPAGAFITAAGKVLVLPAEGADAPPLRRMLESPNSQLVAPPGARFVFPDLAPGRYAVALALPGSGSNLDALQLVDVRDEAVEVDLVVSEPDRTRYVEVTLLDADGTPVSDAYPWIAYRSKSRNEDFLNEFRIRRGPATWWVRQPAFAAPPEGGRWVAKAQSQGFGSAEADFTPGPTASAEVRFRRAGTLTVTLLGFRGRGLDGVLDVTVSGKSGSGEYVFGGAGRPDAAGRVTIGPLVPGRYTLSLAVSKQTGPGSSSSRGIAEKEIEVTAGPQAVEFEVPPLHDLAVEMGSARAGAAVQLSRVWFKGDSADPANRRTQTLDTEYADETGRVLFQRLQAGPYEVWSPELPRQRITVPETTVVRY